MIISLKKIVLKKDGGYVLISESEFTTTRGSAFNRSEYMYGPMMPIDYYSPITILIAIQPVWIRNMQPVQCRKYHGFFFRQKQQYGMEQCDSENSV